MKISIYQGFQQIHYEMLGYIIEYFLSSNIKIDIYAHLSTVGKDWKQCYENIFKHNITFLDPNGFNPDFYELIFLVTDDDISFSQEWLNNYKNKIVCIDHSANIRRYPVDMTRIGTRFFYNRPNCLWALPVYTCITKNDKKQLIKNTNVINVLCIGIQNRPYSGEFLKNIFFNFESINFNVITRHLHSKYENYENIKTYENCSTSDMMEILKTTHYILCFENPHNLEPVANSISAAIPLAFSTGCQLIIPLSWQKYYNFSSVITYEDTLLQKNNKTSVLTLTKEINLEKIYDETFELISHKNRIFDQILTIKFTELLINTVSNSFYSKIINSLFLKKPNILIDITGNNNLEGVSNEFREIYTINNDNLINYKKNIYYYDSLINLQNRMMRIPESIIVHLLNDSNIQTNLQYLTKRTYIDAIIIEGINSKDIINENYKRKHVEYNINNSNCIIILSI